jgi:hypothetical protein
MKDSGASNLLQWFLAAPGQQPWIVAKETDDQEGRDH